MTLWELRELAKPILEQEEQQRKLNIARFLHTLAPKGYPKAETGA